MASVWPLEVLGTHFVILAQSLFNVFDLRFVVELFHHVLVLPSSVVVHQHFLRQVEVLNS